MNWIKKGWNYLDGKKNKIANTILALSVVGEFTFPQHTTVYKVSAAIGLFAKTVGIAHKVWKGEIELPSGLRKSKNGDK